MYIINTLKELNTIKSPNLLPILELVREDLNSTLEDLNITTTKPIHDFIIADNKFDNLVIDNFDILNSTCPKNILFFNNNIIKASVIVNKFKCISIYFYKFSNPLLLNWVLKNPYFS